MNEQPPEAGDPTEAPRLILWMGVCEEAGWPALHIKMLYATSEQEARQQLEAWMAKDSRQLTLVEIKGYPHGLTIHRTTLPGTR